MKILFCGDAVGQSGRTMIFNTVPALRRQLNLDFVVTNGENAAHGFGLTPKLYQAFLDHGSDVITLGNHAFDKQDINPVLENPDSVLIRRNDYDIFPKPPTRTRLRYFNRGFSCRSNRGKSRHGLFL